MLQILSVAFLVAVVVLAVRTVVQVRSERRQGWRECAIRPLDGAVPISTVEKWRHGSALPDVDGMDFRPGGPLGFRFPRGRVRSIRVRSAVRLPGVRPSWRQAWSVGPDLDVARVSTADGAVELAAQPQDLDHLLSHWAVEPDTGPGSGGVR